VVARAGRRSRGPIRRAFDRPPASRFHDGCDVRGSRRRRPTPATPAAAAAAQRAPHRTGSQHNQRAETGKVTGHDQGIFFIIIIIIITRHIILAAYNILPCICGRVYVCRMVALR